MAVISEPETYSVATPPSFSDVEVTPHEGYITMTINGVDFNLKTAASVSLISFSINNATYQAEDGMTWSEWVASEYNTGGYVVRANAITSGGMSIVDHNYTAVPPISTIVSPTDTIKNGYIYQLSGGAGN